MNEKFTELVKAQELALQIEDLSSCLKDSEKMCGELIIILERSEILSNKLKQDYLEIHASISLLNNELLEIR